jgi:hypothetical protein
LVFGGLVWFVRFSWVGRCSRGKSRRPQDFFRESPGQDAGEIPQKISGKSPKSSPGIKIRKKKFEKVPFGSKCGKKNVSIGGPDDIQGGRQNLLIFQNTYEFAVVAMFGPFYYFFFGQVIGTFFGPTV